MDIELVSTRAAIPAITAASARPLACIQNKHNANPCSAYQKRQHSQNTSSSDAALRTVKVIYEHEQVAVINVTGGGKSYNIRLTG